MNKEQKSLSEIRQEQIKDIIISNIESLPENTNKESVSHLVKIVKSNLEQLEDISDISQKSEELRILHNYQENYLKLIREYKEEIKFLNTTQEDLRKERSKFFSQTLEEVNESLKKSSINDELSQKWTQELVSSYTNSLNTSSELVDSQVLDAVEEIKKRSIKLTENVKKS